MSTPRSFRIVGRQNPRKHSFVAGLLMAVLATPCLGQVETSVSEPQHWSDVAAAEQGVLQEILVKAGDRIRRGDVIARLDVGDLQQSIVLAEMKSRSQAKIKAAQAKRKLQESHHENLVQLSIEGHANPQEVAQSAAQLEQLDAELLLAEEQQKLDAQEVLRLNTLLERRIVRSPIDGVVSELHRRVGEFVSASEPKVATVVNLDQLRVRFYLVPAQLEKLQPQLSIQIQSGDRHVPAWVEFVSPVTDPRTGLSRVDVLIDNSQLKPGLRSGTTCRLPFSSPTSPIAANKP
ncbi:MAG: efflux RND transporter periplasmic adaptor subunit [Pirellula sp.]